MAKFYITSAIPYVNAKPHIGWATEIIQADTIARFHRVEGDETLYLCGSDENALKNVQAAEKENIPVQEFVNKNSKYFIDLAKKLHVQFDIFQKGSSGEHKKSSQELWKLCDKNNDIYKKKYSGLYCVGCELFYERSELNKNGECFEHPGKKLEEIEEENYFFKLSRYKDELVKLIMSDTLTIVPHSRKNEVLTFLKGDLKDISISRSNERAKNWGVPVPSDNTQRMYVWFDALNIYQSGVGFTWDDKKYQKWWPADIHVIGKGIIRFHAIYWPAFLLSAGLKLPKKLFVHEYITVNGQKMSKTLGNIVDPFEMINKFGAETVRYYCLRYISPFADGDFSENKLKQAHNADLANGLGNLISRVARLCEMSNYTQMGSFDRTSKHITKGIEYADALSEFRFPDGLYFIWKQIAELDLYINKEKPWELATTNIEKLASILDHCVDRIQEIAILLDPFMPETSTIILEQFKGPKIKSQTPLFPRL